MFRLLLAVLVPLISALTCIDDTDGYCSTNNLHAWCYFNLNGTYTCDANSFCRNQASLANKKTAGCFKNQECCCNQAVSGARPCCELCRTGATRCSAACPTCARWTRG